MPRIPLGRDEFLNAIWMLEQDEQVAHGFVPLNKTH